MFDTWANRATLRSLASVDPPPERGVALLAHIAETERLWLDRLRGLSADIPPWLERSIEQVSSEIDTLERRWVALLESTTPDELGRPIAYPNTSGVPFDGPPRDLIMHVILHGQEHRGQIGQEVTAAGGEWSETQYAWWLRDSDS